MSRPLKWGILDAGTIILSEDFICGSNFYESDFITYGQLTVNFGYIIVKTELLEIILSRDARAWACLILPKKNASRVGKNLKVLIEWARLLGT